MTEADIQVLLANEIVAGASLQCSMQYCCVCALQGLLSKLSTKEMQLEVLRQRSAGWEQQVRPCDPNGSHFLCKKEYCLQL